MPTHKELRQLARLRLQEAQALYAAGFYDGCAYLAGYVVELALKARICRLLHVTNYPEHIRDFRTHDLETLRLLSGLEARFNPGLGDPALIANWGTVVVWKPIRRYWAPGTTTQVDAQDVLAALSQAPHGILTWISRRW